MKPFSVPGLAPLGGCQGFSSTSLPRLASIRRPKYDASWRAAGIATKLSGYYTPRFLQRYNIIDESDLHEAVKKVEDHNG
jgi:hypothetical protein